MNRFRASLILALTLGVPAATSTTGASNVAANHAGDTLPAASGPNLVVNGGFERGADPQSQLILAAGTTFLDGWTVVNPGCCGVVYVGTNYAAEEGQRSLNLSNPVAGSMQNAGGVTQAVATTPGQKYLLTFYQAGNPFYKQPMTIRVQVAGLLTNNYTYQEGAQNDAQHVAWVQRAIVFTARATPTAIGFYAFQTCCNTGLGLDNVQLRAFATAASTGTPGPGVITNTVTLQIATPAIAAGSAQTIRGIAGKSAAVAVVVDYPDGTQVLAPLKADSSGHYLDKWTVPANVHGTVHVLVDSAGMTARGNFSVK